MAVTYTWKVTGIKTQTVNDTPNVIVQTYWKKIGTENGYTGEFSGATPFTANSMPEGTTFVPFEELTEEIVLGWIKAVVVDNYEVHVNEQIAKQMAIASNPIVEVGLPWTSNTTESTANT